MQPEELHARDLLPVKPQPEWHRSTVEHVFDERLARERLVDNCLIVDDSVSGLAGEHLIELSVFAFDCSVKLALGSLSVDEGSTYALVAVTIVST